MSCPRALLPGWDLNQGLGYGSLVLSTRPRHLLSDYPPPPPPPRGGGVNHHITGYAPVSKKRRKGVFFRHWRRRFSVKRGGGGSLTTWLAMHLWSKKSIGKVCFLDIGGVCVFLLKGMLVFFLIFHRTLGVPGSQNVRGIVQSGIFRTITRKICHLGLCFAGVMSFRGANVTWCDAPFRVHFIGWWMHPQAGISEMAFSSWIIWVRYDHWTMK